MAVVGTKSVDTYEKALCTVKHHALVKGEGNLNKKLMLPVLLVEIMRITVGTPKALTMYKHCSK